MKSSKGSNLGAGANLTTSKIMIKSSRCSFLPFSVPKARIFPTSNHLLREASETLVFQKEEISTIGAFGQLPLHSIVTNQQ